MRAGGSWGALGRSRRRTGALARVPTNLQAVGPEEETDRRGVDAETRGKRGVLGGGECGMRGGWQALSSTWTTALPTPGLWAPGLAAWICITVGPRA